MLVSINSTDKFDNSALAVECSDGKFGSIEASLCQVVRRTRANEPLKIAQQTIEQKGFEARHAIVRRHDQRILRGKKSACAALISNISERDRAKDVQQFDDMLRTLINETNKFGNRFGTIRDEEKMLAVRKLMLESLLNFRFQGTTMPYSELTSR